jgi:hypothetical protein
MTTAFWTEQSKHGLELARGTGTRSKQNVLSNVRSIDKTVPDQGLYEVGGDGFEPPTPAL